MKKTILTISAILSMFVSAQLSAESYFVLLKTADMDGLNKAASKIRANGAEVSHLYPPNAAVVEAKTKSAFDGVPEIVGFYLNAIPAGDIDQVLDATIKLVMKAWNFKFTAEGKKAIAITPEGLRSAAESCGGARENPVLEPKWVPSPYTSSKVITAYPYKPTIWETSRYMLGSTSIKVFHEQGVASLTDWSEAQITASIAICQNGMNYWATQNADAKLTFVWHFETLTGTPSVDLDLLRKADKTDWAFYVRRQNDPGGRSYAFLGGPYTMFYPDSRGAVVLSHEAGHIYTAIDEYCPDACIPKTGRYGYLKELNTNSDAGGVTGLSCMMKDLTGLCVFSKNQLGWRDTDSDGTPDILDVNPTVESVTPPANPKKYEPFLGRASTVPYPATLNTGVEGTLSDGYHDITINKIKSVSYRLDGGSWAACSPADGSFDDQVEEFTFIPIAQTDTPTHTLELRTTDSSGNISTTFSTTITDIPVQIPPSFVKVYPNPFNPLVGKANIFSGASGLGIEAFVYSLSGEKIRTLSGSDIDAASGMISWDGKTDGGDICKSGLFMLKVKSGAISATGKVLIIIN